MLERDVVRKFALEPGSTSASGDLSIEHVYCLGLCSAGPAAMIDNELMAHATPQKIAAAFEARAKAAK
jgi:formate dehydrogenase subunit gamma